MVYGNSRHEFKRADNEPVIRTHSKNRGVRIDSRKNGVQVASNREVSSKQSQPAQTDVGLHDGNRKGRPSGE